jgi:DUF1680 family protein
MDYYERTLFNHILMSFSHTADGGTTYFMPLAPGSCKHYETEENSCCHGTGMESRFRYMSDIYSYEDKDGRSLIRVELPVSSVLDDEEKLTVRFDDDGRLAVHADADMKRELAVRIPEWARDEFAEAEDGYLYFGKLGAGEEVSIDLPMQMREITASDERYYSLACGPYLLAAVSDSEEYVDPYAEGTELKPLYMIDHEHYHIYFKRV